MTQTTTPSARRLQGRLSRGQLAAAIRHVPILALVCLCACADSVGSRVGGDYTIMDSDLESRILLQAWAALAEESQPLRSDTAKQAERREALRRAVHRDVESLVAGVRLRLRPDNSFSLESPEHFGDKPASGVGRWEMHDGVLVLTCSTGGVGRLLPGAGGRDELVGKGQLDLLVDGETLQVRCLAAVQTPRSIQDAHGVPAVVLVPTDVQLARERPR